jgi:5,5'-dehydrodivanillate O-demethylase oxygenase subunit
VIREPHQRIDLPCERDKFHAGAQFALDFLAMGSSRYSPQLDALRKLHINAAARQEAAAS